MPSPGTNTVRRLHEKTQKNFKEIPDQEVYQKAPADSHSVHSNMGEINEQAR